MATPWQQPPVYPWSAASNWPQQLYYSPGYWQYVPTQYPMYQQPAYSERTQTRPLPRPEIELHRFLGGHRRPTAVWDVTQDINQALRVSSRGPFKPVNPRFLATPATQPPISRMRILCDWPVYLDLPPRAPDKFISIRIVLDAIYGTLHEPLDPEEWQDMCAGDRRRTYRAMCTRLANSPPLLRAKGQACRIDSLSGKTMFLGLKPGGASPEEWVLTLGPRGG